MITRRSFLASAVGAGAGLVLVACGSNDDGGADGGAAVDDTTDDGGTADGGGTTPSGVFDLVRRFPTTALVPGMVRMPISLGRDGQALTDGPDELTGQIVDESGAVLVDGLTATKRSEGLPHAYWPFVADVPTTGIYTLLVDGAAPQGAAFQVNDPSTVAIPLVGDPLPPFDTPTVDDARGVDPICTQEPPCPLHDVTLTEALASGKPVAYLVGTPAYCQTGVCGPILELLLELREEFGNEMTFLHAEIYSDETLKETSPAVQAYQLDFEPLLFVADATGTLVARLDAVFDKSEMRDAIELALAGG
ncbi:MAG: hypothetical protein AB7Q42_21550 [Acidimicrobiia bacterium]